MNSNIPDPTLRDLTQNNGYIGQAGTEFKKGIAWDMNSNVPDTTLRDLTQHNTYVGGVGHGSLYKPQVFDMTSNIPDSTLRDLTQNNTYIGGAGTEFKKGIAWDMISNIPDPTLRQLTQDNRYLGSVGLNQGEKGGYHVAQAGTFAPNTLRQLTQDNRYLGSVGLHQGEKGGYHVAHQNTVAPNTLRQLTQDTKQLNPPVLHEGYKTRRRKDVDNSLVNIAKENAIIGRDGGAPTTSNYNKGPTLDYSMVQICEPIQINRALYGHKEGLRPLQCTPTMYTRVANVLPQQSWRFDTCIVNNLKTNPYINNIVHKSVEY